MSAAQLKSRARGGLSGEGKRGRAQVVQGLDFGQAKLKGGLQNRQECGAVCLGMLLLKTLVIRACSDCNVCR
jgi:hypothetical protein